MRSSNPYVEAPHMIDAPRAVTGARRGPTDARQSGPPLRETARSKDPPTSPVQTAPPGVLSGPIAPAMLRLALPTIGVLVVQTLVGVTETYFVSFLGTEALAGVALVFPVLMLVQMMGGFYAKCDRCGGEVRAARSGPPGAPRTPRAGCGSRGSVAACRRAAAGASA